MNSELLTALDALEKETGISKEIMFDTIENALFEEYKTQYDETSNCRVVVDRDTGALHIYSDREVVPDDFDFEQKMSDSEEENTNAKKEKKINKGKFITLSEAVKIKKDAQIGDTVVVELKTDGFTRTASKSAKNKIVQKIREEQKSALYNEYKAKKGTLVTGRVQRIDDKGNVLLDLGKIQEDLRVEEQVPGEVYRTGDRVRVCVKEVENKEKRGVKIKLSRKAPELVKCLYEEGITEIANGIVEIKGVAREAGSRTKLAVMSHDPQVDPLGACVGHSGERVRKIIEELGGSEQIDVVNWDENPAQFIVNALSPAKVVSISADEDDKKAKLVVADHQLSLAIGKAGQNVRLAAKLTGYGIDIKSESQVGDDFYFSGGDDEEADDEMTGGEDVIKDRDTE